MEGACLGSVTSTGMGVNKMFIERSICFKRLRMCLTKTDKGTLPIAIEMVVAGWRTRRKLLIFTWPRQRMDRNGLFLFWHPYIVREKSCLKICRPEGCLNIALKRVVCRVKYPWQKYSRKPIAVNGTKNMHADFYMKLPWKGTR